MGHKIVEAIIENGQIKHVDKKLPAGRLKVHLVYDTVEAPLSPNDAARLVKETSGIYKNIDADAEARTMRSEWQRNVR